MNTRPNAESGLMLATAIAGGTLAYADPVRFDNDGTFEWTDGAFLNITKPLSKQTGLDAGEGSFRYEHILAPCCAPSLNPWVTGSTFDAELEGGLAVSVRSSGAVVPNDFAGVYGRTWRNAHILGYYYSSGAGFYTQFDKPIPFTGPGDVGYIAARFHIDGQTHYGWMSLTLTRYTGVPVPGAYVFDLIAWGYETEPGRRIAAGAVPAPGAALALLAFGSAAGATRGRRE